LLAVEGLLLLFEQFQWLGFNERKGWTVLIAVVAVCLAAIVMLLWLAASLLFRWRFQFSLRSLVVLVVTVAISCCWLAVKMREAERQRQAAKAIREAHGYVGYDYRNYGTGPSARKYGRLAPAWLIGLFGVDFFSDVRCVSLCGAGNDVSGGISNVMPKLRGLTEIKSLILSNTQVTDGDTVHLTGLTKLEDLNLTATQITDVGLENLTRMKRLYLLSLDYTNVTAQGVERLSNALPNCEIIWWDEEAAQDQGWNAGRASDCPA